MKHWHSGHKHLNHLSDSIVKIIGTDSCGGLTETFLPGCDISKETWPRYSEIHLKPYPDLWCKHVCLPSSNFLFPFLSKSSLHLFPHSGSDWPAAKCGASNTLLIDRNIWLGCRHAGRKIWRGGVQLLECLADIPSSDSQFFAPHVSPYRCQWEVSWKEASVSRFNPTSNLRLLFFHINSWDAAHSKHTAGSVCFAKWFLSAGWKASGTDL